MGLTSEFRDAVNFIDTVDFAATFRTEIPMFETVIRFLGGLISAYDMSGQTEPVLLAKAIQLGDNLIGALTLQTACPVFTLNGKTMTFNTENCPVFSPRLPKLLPCQWNSPDWPNLLITALILTQFTESQNPCILQPKLSASNTCSLQMLTLPDALSFLSVVR